MSPVVLPHLYWYKPESPRSFVFQGQLPIPLQIALSIAPLIPSKMPVQNLEWRCSSLALQIFQSKPQQRSRLISGTPASSTLTMPELRGWAGWNHGSLYDGMTLRPRRKKMFGRQEKGIKSGG